MKKALLTGVAGQDGSYLAEFLLSKKYEVFGVALPGSAMTYVPDKVHILYGDLSDTEFTQDVIRRSSPDEVYNLAGITDLKTAYASPEMTWNINYKSVGLLLDACLKINPNIKFLQASSSEIFLPSATPLTESSSRDWQTKNPYAKAKLMADHDFIARSRQVKNAFACSAILFNHESPRRPETSVLRKISRSLVKLSLDPTTAPLILGNVEMSRDWGFAGDYVVAMWKMLRLDAPQDLVIATGQLHTVREAVEVAARCLDMVLVWQGAGLNTVAHDHTGKIIVKTAPEFFKPAEQLPKVGDIRQAAKVIAWQPTVEFRSLVEMMVKAELEDDA